MGIILNIDTASENAHVSIAKDGVVLDFISNNAQKDHATFLQPAIKKLTEKTAIPFSKIDAVAVTAGPGSYTGLRVGMASAKGLCYALKKPLITLSSLEVLAASAFEIFNKEAEAVWYCPIMDARRMEVFTAIYQKNLSIILQPCALILDEFSYHKELSENKILFFGNGSDKWKAVCKNANALFENVSFLPKAMAKRSNHFFTDKYFTELAYSEPYYLKEFQSVIK